MTPGGEHFAGNRMGQAGSGVDAEFVRSAVGQFERPLVGYATHLLAGDVERARDVVQEAFCRLCAEPRQRVEPHLREWLYAVCRNLAIDIRRKERRMQLMGETEADVQAADGAEPDDAVEREDSFSHVLHAMQSLSANQQEVVRLKFQHGMSYKQIAEVTKLSVTNVGFLLHTAIKTLRQQMGEAADSR
jgi:RNA polymerase sigma factor (sigma-70 family)